MSDGVNRVKKAISDSRKKFSGRVRTTVDLALSYGDEDAPIGTKRLRVATARHVLQAALAEILETDVGRD